MKQILLSVYGLKFNPFIPDIPVEALYSYPALDQFAWRIENSFIREGGFALISGDPGMGKSATLRILAEKLALIRDVKVGILTRPSANLADFYRELGEIFIVPVNVSNRWVSFKNLRECWQHHLNTSLRHSILLIDEAQEVQACVLNELRLLTSVQFDSRLLLSVVLAGDQRLNDKMRCSELLPLGSRIRVRFNIGYASTEQLLESLKHLLNAAGNPALMSQELMKTLCDHAMGNYRVLCNMAGELLAKAAQEERSQLDEKLYFDCFATPVTQIKRKHS